MHPTAARVVPSSLLRLLGQLLIPNANATRAISDCPVWVYVPRAKHAIQMQQP